MRRGSTRIANSSRFFAPPATIATRSVRSGQAYPDVAKGTEFLRNYKRLWEKLVSG